MIKHLTKSHVQCVLGLSVLLLATTCEAARIAAPEKASIGVPAHLAPVAANVSHPEHASNVSKNGSLHLLQQAVYDEPPETIHTMPQMLPGEGYKKHLKKIYREANKDGDKHTTKLEKENKKLRQENKILESALSDSEKADIQQEIEVAEAARLSAGDKYSGETTALFLVGTICLGGQLFAMMQSSQETVRAKTWSAIERIMIVFVAIMWFQAFDDFFSWAGASLEVEAVASTIHAAIVFALLVTLAVKLMYRDETGAMLSVLTAWGVHYLSFMLVHSGAHIQEAFFSEYWWLCLLSLPFMLLCHIAVCYVTRQILIRALAAPEDAEDEHFVDKIEELEDDAGGMMMAFLVTMAVRYCIAGRYASLEDGERSATHGHSWNQRLGLLGYAAIMCLLTAFALPRLNALGMRINDSAATNSSYFMQRMVLLLNPFLTMSAAWSFMLWADWEFYEHIFRDRKILARICVALLMSFGCFTTIWVYGVVARRLQHPDRTHHDQLRRATSRALDLAWRWSDLERRKFILNAVALLVAYPWQETLDVSVESAMMGTGSHPWGLKLFLAFLLTAVLVPIYLFFIRELAQATEKAEDVALAF